MSATEAIEKFVGTHRVRYEPPDLFLIEFIGEIRGEDFAKIGEMFGQANKRFYVIADATKFTSFSAEAKKVIREIPVSSGNAVYGAPFQARLVLSILNKVYMMANLGREVPLEFCDSESSARTWVDKIRQKQAGAST